MASALVCISSTGHVSVKYFSGELNRDVQLNGWVVVHVRRSMGQCSSTHCSAARQGTRPQARVPVAPWDTSDQQQGTRLTGT